MRATLLACGLVLLAGAGLALDVPAGTSAPWPGVARATPLACEGECRIGGTAFGYVPPVLEIASGSSVVWEALGIGGGSHVNADGLVAAGSGSCMSGLHWSSAEDSDPVTFTLVGATLQASTNGGPARTCTTGVALPDGAVALPYFCTLHPPMRATLVVSP